MQRDPSERDAWLRDACRGDSGLQREVASLLANHHEGTDFQPWAAAAAAQLIGEAGSLKAGQRLGPYEILAPIGKGGMGEVYKARDTRLHRDVAIKICAAQFSERFEREARAIAALNHPNICQLYDVGPNFLVMELVEGENLSSPLPMEMALNYARQIVDALEAAHEKGIVHRDLKPANIKITPAGAVKVLDFGLAKAIEEPAPTRDPSDSPTKTMSATRAGMVIGTAAYMSPEQARGTVVDKRADIWAFGCVLYEILTGKKAFHGETTSDILAAVLKEEPDWSRVPAGVQPLLRRCLAKDPKRRLRDIGDAMPLLDGVPEPPTERRLLPWISAVVLLLLALPAVWLLHPKPDERMLQLEVTAPPGHTFGGSSSYRYAISPDGSKLVFVATSADGKRTLWVRRLDAFEATRLPGTEGAIGPFWDPSSRWIAFGANGKLQRIDVNGGQPQVLCDGAPEPLLGTWSRDGVILFHDINRSIRRVPAAGGAPLQVLPPDESRKENGQFFPQFLPDNRSFLYLSLAQQNGIALGSLDGKSRFLIINPDSMGLYTTSRERKGYLLFLRGHQLMAQRFNAETVALSGEPVSIAQPLQTGPSFSASENGVLVFRRVRGGRKLTWFNRDGKPLGTAGDAGSILSPMISPDQNSVVFGVNEGMSFSIWLVDGERGNTTRFTSGAGSAVYPIWSPDGSRIAYASRRSNETLIIVRPASGMGRENVLYRAAGTIYSPQCWSRNGRWLMLAQFSGSFYLLPMSPAASGSDRKLIPLPESPAEGRHPSISPDGRWLLYSSTQTGSREVFVESMPVQMGGPAAGGRKQVSIAGGTQPVWRADGKEIFYLAVDGKMMSVSVESGSGSLKLGVPKPLFQTRLELDNFSRLYDVSADGKRFLLAQSLEESTSAPISVIVNWPALLKKGSDAP